MTSSAPTPKAQAALQDVLVLVPRSPRRALAVARSALRRLDGAPAEDRARILRALGHALRAVGQHREARDAYLRARRAFATGGNRFEEAVCALGLVDACMHLGRIDEALAVARSARRQFSRRRDGARLARLETNVGNVHHSVDALESALRHYDRAASLMSRAGNPAERARVDFNRANILASLGRIEEAQGLYAGAWRVLDGSGERVLAAQVRYGVACLQLLSGRYAAAMSELEGVRPELERLGARGLLALADLDLAEVLVVLRLDPEALALARSAARWFRARSMPGELARLRLIEAQALARMGRHADATRALKQAGTRFRQEGNEAGLAAIAMVQGRILGAAGRPRAAAARAEAARLAFRRAGFATRALLAGVLGCEALAAARDDRAVRRRVRLLLALPRSPGDGFARARLLRLLGRSEATAGRPRQALRHYRAALDENERSGQALFVDEWRLEFEADEPPLLDESLDLLLLRRPRPSCEEIWAWIARANSRGVPAARREAAAPPGVRSLQARLRAELEACYLRLWPGSAGTARRLAGGEARRLEHRALSLEGRLRRLAAFRAVRERGGDASARRSAPASRGGRGSPPSLANGLRPGEARVALFVTGERVGAIATTARGAGHVFDLAPRAQLEQAIQLLHYQMDLGSLGSSRVAGHERLIARRARAHLEELGAALLAPIRERLQGATRIHFVTTGALSRIPFAALLVGNRPLVESCEVCVEPWAGIRRRSRRHRTGACVLGFGDERAPWIEQEARSVARRLEADGTRVRFGVGRKARLELLASGIASDAVIHLAGHALFRSEHPEFSAMRLADGWLTAADFAAWPVDGACLILSACETGPRAASGGEMLGLARGLLRAGAGTVVASLWRVDDRATRRFMDSLYAAWQSHDHLGAALRDVQLRSIRAGLEPRDWASFVLLGRPDVGWPRDAKVPSGPRVGTIEASIEARNPATSSRAVRGIGPHPSRGC